MKKNLGAFSGLAHVRVGVALVALCALIPVSRAAVTVVVDNTLADNSGNAQKGSDGDGTYAQVFTMPTGSGYISSLTLTLGTSSSGSDEVYVYKTSSGVPTTSLYDVGSVSPSSLASPTDVAVSITSPTSDVLTGGGTYAIVLVASGTISWEYTDGTANDSGSGTLGEGYQYISGSWSSTSPDRFQLNLQVMPEVPITGTLMGFGALVIAVGHTLRRKPRPTWATGTI